MQDITHITNTITVFCIKPPNFPVLLTSPEDNHNLTVITLLGHLQLYNYIHILHMALLFPHDNFGYFIKPFYNEPHSSPIIGKG